MLSAESCPYTSFAHYERVLKGVGGVRGRGGAFGRQEKFPSPPRQQFFDLPPYSPFFTMTCQQGGFHGMDGLCLCGILSFFNKARFIMKLLEKARAAG